MIAHFLEFLNRLFEQVPNTILPLRRWILLAFFSITAVMLFGVITKFNMDLSFETMFTKNDPVRKTLNRFRSQFGSDDGLYMVYEAADGDVFSERSIATIEKLHKELDDARVARGEKASELNRIERIDSLYNIRLQKVEGDTLISQKLLATDFPQDEQQREQKRSLALKEDTFRLAYFSEDFKYGGIRIKTDFGTIPVKKAEDIKTESQNVSLLDDDFGESFSTESLSAGLTYDASIAQEEVEYESTQMEEYLQFMQDIKNITEKPEYKHFTFYYSGNAAMMEFSAQTFIQGSALLGLMVVVFVFLLWFLFKSFSAVLWPISVIAISALWAVGIFSWLGITMSNLVMLMIMLIMAVGVASCIHVLSTYGIYRNEGLAHLDALTKSYRQTGTPIFLASITTMAGMLSLVVSDIPQIMVFGLLSAVGVFVAFLMVMFILPICLEYSRPYSDIKHTNAIEKKTNPFHTFLITLPLVIEKFALPIFIAFVSAFCIFVYGTTKVKVDTNITEQTREGSTIRIAANIIDHSMMGGQNMEVILDFKEANAVKDSEVLKAIESFQKEILIKYPQYIVKSFSIADYVKDTNKAMHEDRDEYRIIPDDSRLSAQLLYMFDNSNPEDRRNLVSDDYSKTHITIQLRNAGTYEYTDIFTSLENDIVVGFEKILEKYPDSKISTTGTLPMMMKLLDKMNWAQIKSFGLAIIIISIFLIFSLNSVKGGAISMLPNVLPSICTFGLMGLLDVSLSTDTLIVAPLIIGIAVDDTIHFMAHYRDAWFRTGDMRESLKETMLEVGQAVTFTTIVLATGFAVLVFSDFLGIAKIGGFGALAILVALACDLLLLPASIVLFKPDLGRKKYLASINNQPASSVAA